MRPSEWSKVLGSAVFMRKLPLPAAASAATAEIIRLTREPVSPIVLNSEGAKNPAFEDLVASFGEVSK